MAILPKVKLKTIPVFPAAVSGGNAIDVTKENGEYTIDLDVSDFQIAAVADADTPTVYAVSWGYVTADNPEGSYRLVPFSGLQGASQDLTSLADLGTFGIVARTAGATYATRTITAGTGLGVTNGNGVSGNPTVALTDAELLALAGLTSAADKLPYFTGSGTASLADFTTFGRQLVDDADATAARTTLGLGTVATLAIDTDGTLAANSDIRVATQKAVKTYADALIAAQDAMVFKGATDCSGNPNYPAADRGHTYRVSVAGKIGGASGIVVEAGDMFICLTDSTASGNQATVGANWSIIQTNIDGAVIGPSSVTDDLPAIFDGTTGKLIKSKTYAAFKTLLALVKGDVGLGNVDNTSDATKNAAAVALTNKTSFNGVALDNLAWTSYTPTVTSASGTLTSASATGRYKQLGKTIFLEVDATVTTAGTGAGGLRVTLPFASANFNFTGAAYEYGVSATSGAAIIRFAQSTAFMSTVNASGATFIANGAGVMFGITYEIP